jgi:hypothetical protein
MALVLADLSKAFDCIPYDILIAKLEKYGLNNTALATMKSYFQDRMHVVCVDGAFSQPLPVKHGVPQGSVLGPVVFLLIINDLGVLGDVLLFEDDTTIFAGGNTPDLAHASAMTLFEDAKRWFSANQLCLNEGKTQELICSLSAVDGRDQGNVKLLGLTWSDHIANTFSKLARIIFLLRKLKPMLPKQYLITVNHALFHSHIIYGLLLWGHASGCN